MGLKPLVGVGRYVASLKFTFAKKLKWPTFERF